MENRIGFKVPLLNSCLFDTNLLCFFSLGQLFFLLFSESSIVQIFAISCPRASIITDLSAVLDPSRFDHLGEVFLALICRFFIQFLQKFFVIFIDRLSFEFALLFEVLEFCAEDETFGCRIWVRTIPVSSEAIHLLTEIVNWQ